MSRTEYFLKRPGSGRVSFAVVKRDIVEGRKPANTTIKNERLAAINTQFQNGALPLADAELQAVKLVDELNDEQRKKQRGSYVASEANLKLLKKYWDKVYRNRKLVDKNSAWCRLRRAIEVLGPLSVLASADKIQQAVDTKFKKFPRKQRAAASTLNEIRKHFGLTEETIQLEKLVMPKFRYLEQPEFEKAIMHVEDPRFVALFTLLFFSGLRVGEAFALEKNSRRGGVITVHEQMLRDGTITGRKNASTRPLVKTVLLGDKGWAFDAWVKVKDKDQIVRNNLARVLSAACEKAFPNEESKWLSVHDLRHSFAVMCLQRHGYSLETVAKLLGDSIYVVEKYYARFAHADDILEMLLEKAMAS